MRVSFKNTPNTHFFACLRETFRGPTLCLQPSERTQFLLFGLPDIHAGHFNRKIENLTSSLHFEIVSYLHSGKGNTICS